jgi:hypothetical protein
VTQAIVTKLIQPTAVKGMRLRARTPTHSVIVPWRPMLTPDENHRYAAMKLFDMVQAEKGVHAVDRVEPAFFEGQIDDETCVFILPSPLELSRDCTV